MQQRRLMWCWGNSTDHCSCNAFYVAQVTQHTATPGWRQPVDRHLDELGIQCSDGLDLALHVDGLVVSHRALYIWCATLNQAAAVAHVHAS
jgi:hypothetical protein